MSALAGSPVKGLFKHIASSFSAGIFYGDTSSIAGLRATPQDYADIEAYRLSDPAGYYAVTFLMPANRVRGIVANSSKSAFGGASYPEQKLRQLVQYLEKRNIYVYETKGNPAFVARANGTGQMYLPANPTTLQVKHELAHFLDFRKMGFEKYNQLGRVGREVSVLRSLQSNRSWRYFNTQEQVFSINYVQRLFSQ